MEEATRGLGAVVAIALSLVTSVTDAQPDAPPPAAPVTTRLGHVESVDKRELVLDLGTNDGVERQSFVEIATREGSVVVQVVSALPESSRTQLPLGVVIEEGAAVRVTAAAPTVTRSLPERASYFGLDTRIFGFPSVSENSGGGVLADVRLRYRAALPIALELRVSPIGFGSGDFTTIGVGHGELGLSYDDRVFGFGVTLGATVTEVAEDGGFGAYRTSFGVSTGVTFRAGARDGLYVEIGVSYGYTPNGFQWVYSRFDGAIPVGSGFWMVVSASGGYTRHGMGTVGFRGLVRGSGGPGSLFLTGYFGGVGIFRPGVFESYSGPLLGLGFEARY